MLVQRNLRQYDNFNRIELKLNVAMRNWLYKAYYFYMKFFQIWNWFLEKNDHKKVINNNVYNGKIIIFTQLILPFPIIDIESIKSLIKAIRNIHSIGSTSATNLVSNNNCTFALFDGRERECAKERSERRNIWQQSTREPHLWNVGRSRERPDRRGRDKKKQIKKCRWIGSR